MIRQSDGFVNATQFCDQYKKNFRRLIKNIHWREYLDEELKDFECEPNGSDHIMYSINIGFDNKFKGYYVDPHLINYVAIWVSPKYAVTVRKIMDKINETVIAEHDADKTQAIADQFHSVMNTVTDTLSNRITELNSDVKSLIPRAVPKATTINEVIKEQLSTRVGMKIKATKYTFPYDQLDDIIERIKQIVIEVQDV
ncbi:MAG: hypothetical protein EZS28_044972 [Streblomastix strix]|uniref:KilA-N domain-containing protein n=1 Tax=Streblomastix strix TaxID=222440 RepID=A0A5J4TQ11_9EUKA|nr:MAG: hypothetical protein EZS28_044972 [Streblomastix strix]